MTERGGPLWYSMPDPALHPIWLQDPPFVPHTLFCSYLHFPKIVGPPVPQGEDFAGEVFFLCVISLSKAGPRLIQALVAVVLIAIVRWLVGCPGLVAVGKLLWVACYELVIFKVLGVGCYKRLAFFLLWIVRFGSFLLLWVFSCALVVVGRLLRAAGWSL